LIQFRKWLEYQFDESMTIENHGTVWHIDHIIPCAIFKLENPEEQSRCFHWSNMRPLNGITNMSRKDDLTFNDIFSNEIKLHEFTLKNKDYINKKYSRIEYLYQNNRSQNTK
jgi:hypothetical protein